MVSQLQVSNGISIFKEALNKAPKLLKVNEESCVGLVEKYMSTLFHVNIIFKEAAQGANPKMTKPYENISTLLLVTSNTPLLKTEDQDEDALVESVADYYILAGQTDVFNDTSLKKYSKEIMKNKVGKAQQKACFLKEVLSFSGKTYFDAKCNNYADFSITITVVPSEKSKGREMFKFERVEISIDNNEYYIDYTSPLFKQYEKEPENGMFTGKNGMCFSKGSFRKAMTVAAKETFGTNKLIKTADIGENMLFDVFTRFNMDMLITCRDKPEWLKKSNSEQTGNTVETEQSLQNVSTFVFIDFLAVFHRMFALYIPSVSSPSCVFYSKIIDSSIPEFLSEKCIHGEPAVFRADISANSHRSQLYILDYCVPKHLEKFYSKSFDETFETFETFEMAMKDTCVLA